MSARPPSGGRCPLCRKPSVYDFRPFCSRACRDRDLIAWSSEGYRLPARSDEDELTDGADGLDGSA